MNTLTRSDPALPLRNVVVLDMGQIYQGPYCGLLLALAGATVIKVEPPHGEPVRARRDSALPLAMLNSNKLGISLNLKHPKGRDTFLRLVDKADIVLHNFAPGALTRIDLSEESLALRNPRAIIANASGYGTWGPDRDRLAMDLTIQATSGAMHVTGFPDRPPVKAGPAVADFLGGVHLYGAIVTALFDRERSGKGRIVEIAMQDAMIPALTSNLTMHQEDTSIVPRTANRHSGLGMAPYNAYATKDGYVTIMCVTEGHWQSLLKAVGRIDLFSDSRFKSHETRCKRMDEVDALVEDWTSKLSREEVQQFANLYRFPCAPVRDLDEVVNDPHMHQRGMLHRVSHRTLGEVVLPHSPLRFGGLQPLPLEPDPELGEHTEFVLHELLGMDAEQIALLRREGAV
jgi:CoA:oxalate CoA-transferase